MEKGWAQFCVIDYVGYIGHQCLIRFSPVVAPPRRVGIYSAAVARYLSIKSSPVWGIFCIIMRFAYFAVTKAY